MYHGTNPTALQSQKMIVDALLELMKNKEFSKISIKELCSKAMVSRQTFYSLFDSKEEVIGLHLDTLFDAYIKKIEAPKKELTVKEICDITILYLIEEESLIQLMVRSNLDHVVKTKIENYLSSIGHLLYTSEREHQEYAIAFLAGALMSVIFQAVKNNDLKNSSMLSQLIEDLITGKYFQN